MDRGRPTWECAACRRQTSVTAGTGPAPQPPAAEDLVPRRAWCRHAFGRHLGPSVAGAIGHRQLQDRLAAAPQAPPRHGRPRAEPAANSGRDRRDRDALPLEDRSCRSQEGRPFASRQALYRRRGGTVRGGPAAPHPSGPNPRRRVERCMASSAGPLRTARMSSPTAGSATRIRPRTPMRPKSSPADARTKSCAGFTGCSPTSRPGPRAFTTACARPMSSAISTNSALRAFSALIRSTGSNDRFATGSEVRWNRRRHTHIAFDRLLGIGLNLGSASYRDFVDHRV